MNTNTPFLILEQPCDEAVSWVTNQMGSAGLQVVRTFDLHDARSQPDAARAHCPCPHHGTEQCDCQMVILLVYGRSHQPVSLVAHAHNGQTWFSVVDTPQQRADPHIVAAIRLVLVPISDGNHGVMQHE